jgi:hypothetical protein
VDRTASEHGKVTVVPSGNVTAEYFENGGATFGANKIFIKNKAPK